MGTSRSGIGLAQRNAMNGFAQTVGTSAEFTSVLEQYTGTGGLIRSVVMPFPNSAGCRFEPVLVDSMTVVLSHSMAEAVTDPDVGVAIDSTGDLAFDHGHPRQQWLVHKRRRHQLVRERSRVCDFFDDRL
jgi:hypothetical protein